MRASLLRFALIAAVTVSSAFADGAYEREFNELKKRREEALAAAAQPIERRFRSELEALLRRATQGGDLDTALKVKQQLGTFGGATVAGGGATQPGVVGSWSLEWENGEKRECEVKPDGTWVMGGKKAGRWNITGKEFTLEHADGKTETYELPIRNGKLVGQTKAGRKVTAAKKE